MQKDHPDDVVSIALNVDHNEEDTAPTDELQKEVLAILTERNMETTNVICSTPFDTMLDKYELFSLPAAIVFDREGKKLEVFEGDLNYEKQVFPLIEKQLSPDGAAAEEAAPEAETEQQ